MTRIMDPPCYTLCVHLSWGKRGDLWYAKCTFFGRVASKQRKLHL